MPRKPVCKFTTEQKVAILRRHFVDKVAVRVVLAEHPQGGTLILPESMLDLKPPPISGRACLFDVSKLVALAHCVGQLKARA